MRARCDVHRRVVLGEHLAANPCGLLRGRVEDLALALGEGMAASVAWAHRCGPGDGRILAMTRRSGAARFGAAVVVSGRDRRGRLPAVALGPGARPTVAWIAGPRAPAPALVRAATPSR